MKRTLIIISILIVSALAALLWVNIDTAISKVSHPLEYEETVVKNAEAYSVPKDLIFAVIKVESGFKSDAVSNKGAVGLMQMTPDTFTWLCEKKADINNDPAFLYNPEISIAYGTCYLDILYSEFGSWELALAAYNAGPSNVREWLKNPEYVKDGVLTYIPFKETREYVEKVMQAKQKYNQLYFKK